MMEGRIAIRPDILPPPCLMPPLVGRLSLNRDRIWEKRERGLLRWWGRVAAEEAEDGPGAEGEGRVRREERR